MTDLADIIVIDPPWSFASNSKDRPGRNARRHYDCMADDELKELHLPLANPGLIFVWVTAPIQWRAVEILKAWRVKPVTEIVWVKSRIATGFWVRNRHEKVWICKRGDFPCPRPAPFLDSVITAPTRQHSRKPDALQDRIDEVWPDARKMEMFARQTRPGWQAWGNEVHKFDAA